MRYLLLLLITVNLMAVNVNTYIPTRAKIYYPMLVKEVEKNFPYTTLPPYFGALVEHESCISLRGRRCWSPTAQLLTKREQGVGFGQITRAWRVKNGRRVKLRFDTLRRMKLRYPNELSELNWGNIKKRPELQLRLIVLLWKGSFNGLPSRISYWNKVAMTDAAYNGGYYGVKRDRRKCRLTKGCNETIWFNNVERTCTKSKRKLYGNRSACDINRHHVRDVLKTRLNKYIKLYDTY